MKGRKLFLTGAALVTFSAALGGTVSQSVGAENWWIWQLLVNNFAHFKNVLFRSYNKARSYVLFSKVKAAFEQESFFLFDQTFPNSQVKFTFSMTFCIFTHEICRKFQVVLEPVFTENEAYVKVETPFGVSNILSTTDIDVFFNSFFRARNARLENVRLFGDLQEYQDYSFDSEQVQKNQCIYMGDENVAISNIQGSIYQPIFMENFKYKFNVKDRQYNINKIGYNIDQYGLSLYSDDFKSGSEPVFLSEDDGKIRQILEDFKKQKNDFFVEIASDARRCLEKCVSGIRWKKPNTEDAIMKKNNYKGIYNVEGFEIPVSIKNTSVKLKQGKMAYGYKIFFDDEPVYKGYTFNEDDEKNIKSRIDSLIKHFRKCLKIMKDLESTKKFESLQFVYDEDAGYDYHFELIPKKGAVIKVDDKGGFDSTDGRSAKLEKICCYPFSQEGDIIDYSYLLYSLNDGKIFFKFKEDGTLGGPERLVWFYSNHKNSRK